jgi:hypothetical protein
MVHQGPFSPTFVLLGPPVSVPPSHYRSKSSLRLSGIKTSRISFVHFIHSLGPTPSLEWFPLPMELVAIHWGWPVSLGFSVFRPLSTVFGLEIKKKFTAAQSFENLGRLGSFCIFLPAAWGWSNFFHIPRISTICRPI